MQRSAEMKALKIIRNIFLFVLLLLIAATVVFIVIFGKDIKTLHSVKDLGSGAYTMTFYKDYKFDEFLKTGAENDDEFFGFINKNLMHGLGPGKNALDGGCTAFVSRNEKGEVIFGRNFDFEEAPFLQLYTNPDNGYSSVSTVSLIAVGYGKDKSPASGISTANFPMLAAPYLPCDGMNEKGVSAALLVVPVVSTVYDPDKVSINQTAAIRLILDKAASTDEAVELLRQYNVYFSSNLRTHILIGDASGKAVIVEYYDGDLQVVSSGKDYQIAANHIAYQDMNIFESPDSLERYAAVEQVITERDNKLDMNTCEELLNAIGLYNRDKSDRLQWSVVYNLTDKSGRIWPHRKNGSAWDFDLNK